MLYLRRFLHKAHPCLRGNIHVRTHLLFFLDETIGVTEFFGFYRWEWINSLEFEWEVFTGKRPWRWSIGVSPLYTASHLTLLCVDKASV